MCFAELVVGFIDEGSDIVGVFYLELIPLQNLVATFEGYRVGHTTAPQCFPCASLQHRGSWCDGCKNSNRDTSAPGRDDHSLIVRTTLKIGRELAVSPPSSFSSCSSYSANVFTGSLAFTCTIL